MENLEKQSMLPLVGRTAWYRDPVLILAIALVFSLDQVTKAVVRSSLLLGESVPRDGVVRITHTFNTGSAFGLFQDQTLFLIVASLVGIGILVMVYRNHSFPSFTLRLALGMQLGGAIGNLADRLRMGHVTDFVDLGFWPVFNVADVSIVIGIFIIAYVFIFAGREAPRRPVPVSGGFTDAGGYQPYHPSLESDSQDLCPICEGAMTPIAGGWRCTGCGVREWVEGPGG